MFILISDVQAKPVFGGQQTFVRYLYNHLKNRGFQVKYIGDDSAITDRIAPFRKSFYFLIKILYNLFKRGMAKEEEQERQYIIPRSNRLNLFLGKFPSLRKLFVSRKDMHVNVLISNSYLDYMAINKYNGIKYDSLIVIKHDAYVKFGKQYPDSLIKNNKFQIISLNKQQLYDLSKQYGKEHVKLIYPGIDVKPFGSKKEHKTKLIFSIGRLEDKQKGFSYSIKAMAELKKLRNDFLYLIAGEGNDRKLYEHIIKENNLENNVKLLGFISDKAKRRLLEETSIFLFPSIKEGFSAVLLEAMLSKSTVLTTRNGSAEDIVKEGINGFFIKLDSIAIARKIDLVLNMPKRKMETLRNNAKSTAGKFTMEVTVSKLIDVVSELNKRVVAES